MCGDCGGGSGGSGGDCVVSRVGSREWWGCWRGIVCVCVETKFESPLFPFLLELGPSLVGRLETLFVCNKDFNGLDPLLTVLF